MMKLVVLAMALTAVSAGTVAYSGFPLVSGGAYPFVGAGFPVVAQGVPTPLTYAQGVPTQVVAAPQTFNQVQLVNPAPYRVQTGVRTEIAIEPVEQHGYIVKY